RSRPASGASRQLDLPSQDLSQFRPRERTAELDSSGNLVRSEPLAQKPANLIGVDRDAGLPDYKGADARDRVAHGHGDNDALRHGRVFEERALNRNRGNLEPTNVD